MQSSIITGVYLINIKFHLPYCTVTHFSVVTVQITHIVLFLGAFTPEFLDGAARSDYSGITKDAR